MAIEFGQLQAIKTRALKGKGPQPNQLQQTFAKIENIFNQHEAYKAQLSDAEQNGGGSAAGSGVPNYGIINMSQEELTAKIAECETEFNNYMALINEQTTQKSQNVGENKEDKNKVQPKNFAGLMA